MAVKPQKVYVRKKKRKRKEIIKCNRKLLVGQEVEVRSVGEGLDGSWNLAIVTGCGDYARYVKYEHLFLDGGPAKVTQSISVSSMIEGVVFDVADMPKHHRGWIRPVPPPLSTNKWSFYYGLCVDAYLNEAWREGVIFDQEDGLEERLVFFPDLGDQQTISIEQLRITQDWNEVSELWSRRNSWLFLELLDKHERESSARQVWHILRSKGDFEKTIIDWTCRVPLLWDGFVLEVIRDMNLTTLHSLDVIVSQDKVILAEGLNERKNGNGGVVSTELEEPQLLLPSDEPDGNSISKPESDSINYCNKRRKTNTSTTGEEQLEEYTPQLILQNEENQSVSDLPSWSEAFSLKLKENIQLDDFLMDDDNCFISNQLYNYYCELNPTEIASMGDDGGLVNANRSSDNCGESSEPLALSVLPSDEGPFACISFDENGEMGARNSLGQEIEAHEAGGTVEGAANGHDCWNEQRYGEAFDNLTCSDGDMLLCLEFPASGKGDHPINTLDRDDEAQGIAVRDARNCPGSGDDPTCNVSIGKHSAPRKYGTWLPVGPDMLPGAEYCPDAIVNYVRLRSPGRKSTDTNCGTTLLKARMHLSHMGWKIEVKIDESKITNKPRFRYISPDGLTMYSLYRVCKHLTENAVKVHSQSSQKAHQSSVNVLTDELLDSNVEEDALLNILEKHQGGEGSGFASPVESLVPVIYERKVEPPNLASSPNLETLDLGLPEREVAPMDPISDIEGTEAEFCPEAVINWCKIGGSARRPSSGAIKNLVLRAKKHLLAIGWNIWYIEKKNKRELRYTSPKGKSYSSLITACKACVEGGLLRIMRPMHGVVSNEESKDQLIGEFSLAINCAEVDGVLPINGQSAKDYTESSGSPQLRELLEFDNVQTKGDRRNQERQNNSSFPLVSGVLQSQTSALWRTSQNGKSSAVSHNKGLELGCNAASQKLRKRKKSGSRIKQRDRLNGSRQTRMLRSSKRARQIVVPSPMHHTPRTVLSCLIDNNVVLPRSKVHYMGRNDHCRLADGRITHEGIRCSCCQNVFGLTTFEAHVTGKTSCRPAANIFLEDGRSLFQCQKQMLLDKLKSSTIGSRERIKRNHPCNKDDYICSVCHYGGTLVLCDQCPSAFHLSCLGLEDLPEGQWSCPSCRCSICDQSKFSGDPEQFTENTILYCDQCEREYHVGCIRERGIKLESCPKGNWFCSEKCEQIFVGLHKLLGKPIQVGVNNLSWTILKASKDDYHDLDASNSETMVEHHSKLNVALGVMHECFNPIKERYTKRDLVEDVLFNKWSELNRLNFWGFYTVLLERGDELISVATVRVHGEKVAEVPLVATRFQYRCQGMCHILMGVLENKLAELGVRRLFLPAIPQVLHTWTTSFQFSKITSNERLKFLEHTFLDFEDTTMCQKILTMTPTSLESRGNQHRLGDELNQNDENIDLDVSSPASEVIQEEDHIEQSEVVQQIPLKVP